MKKTDLKQLIKEEIVKILSEGIFDSFKSKKNSQDLKDLPINQLEPGKYMIKYITMDGDGGPDLEYEDEVNISQETIKQDPNISPKGFWEGEAVGVSDSRIYKVTRVTKV